MAAWEPGHRWWIYQRERFPLFANGLFIASISVAVVAFSHRLRGAGGLPDPVATTAAFVTALLFFLQLRVADEFKDAEDDRRHRPYRPVPRGLVGLGELRIIAIAAAAVQLSLALSLEVALVIPLLAVWGYMILMTNEFFVADWLNARPVAYLLSHMVIMPLIYLYIATCDWLPDKAFSPDPGGLAWMLVMGFSCGLVIEVGRKIRAPVDEEPGVETYSVLWGRHRAVAVWIGSLLLSGISAIVAAGYVGDAAVAAIAVGAMVVVVVAVGVRFLKSSKTGGGKRIERASGLWTLLLHAGLAGVFLLRR